MAANVVRVWGGLALALVLVLVAASSLAGMASGPVLALTPTPVSRLPGRQALAATPEPELAAVVLRYSDGTEMVIWLNVDFEPPEPTSMPGELVTPTQIHGETSTPPSTSAFPKPTEMLFFTATATPTPTAVTAQVGRVAAAWGLNVRSGAGTQYPVVGQLIYGQCMPLLGEESGWWRVEVNGQSGYVSGAWVQVLSACPAPVSLLVIPAPSATVYVGMHAIPTLE